MTRLTLVAAAALAGITQMVQAEFITTASGTGQDVGLQRGSVALSDDAFLRVKNQGGALENNNNDRVALLKFDLSLLTQPIIFGTLRLQMPRGASNGFPNNTFDAGETVYLYGIPDLGAEETANLTTVTWASSDYLTGTSSATNPRPVTDLTGNNVNDSLATLLDTYTWPAVSNAGNLVEFYSPALHAFLQADSNNVATFFVTVSQSNATKTPVFGSSSGTVLRPTLLTNADALPEPTTFALTVLAALSVPLAHRRKV